MALLAGVCAALLVAASPVRADLIIDSFSDTTASWPLTRSTTGTSSASETVTGTLFSTPTGQRLTDLTLSTADVPGLDNVSATIFNGSGYSLLDYASSTGADGLLKLGYLSTSIWPTPAAAVDLSGEAKIRIDFLGFDAPAGGVLTITAKLYDPFGGVNEQSVMVSAPGAQSATIDLYATPSTLDFSHVTRVDFYFDAPKAADFRVDLITTEVPEPATLSLLGLGLGALLMRRRK